MPENNEPIELNEHLTDARITRAIRYLDPDLSAERTGDDTGTVVGVCVTLLITLAGALTYAGLLLWKL